MSGFLFTLLAVFLAATGARDQLTVAGLAARHGPRVALLALAIALSVISAIVAAWAARAISPMLAGNARLMLAAFAFALAGGESLLFISRPPPKEPTQSLFATAVVLLAHQLTDAARFLIFAIAIATSAPIPAAVGGAAGGLAAVTLGWTLPELILHSRLRLVRRAVGAVLLVLAAYLAIKALGRG